MDSVQFWDDIFSRTNIDIPAADDPVMQAARQHFGDIRGRKILDIGCGAGAASLWFAQEGAEVISLDTSQVAIDNLTQFCLDNKIRNIKPILLSALDIPELGKIDYVFGSMILHHIEPFSEFASKLDQVLSEDGKAFFYENNASSSLLIWFRENIVGKLWVPKYGDQDEFPLKPSEVNELRKYFHVNVEIPEFIFFQLISAYLLKGHLSGLTGWIDRQCFRLNWLKKYSYYQYLFLGRN